MNKELRNNIIKRLGEVYVCAESVRVTEVDYSSNPLAPEGKAYKITFRQFGKSRKVTYWPNTVGFQC